MTGTRLLVLNNNAWTIIKAEAANIHGQRFNQHQKAAASTNDPKLRRKDHGFTAQIAISPIQRKYEAQRTSKVRSFDISA